MKAEHVLTILTSLLGLPEEDKAEFVGKKHYQSFCQLLQKLSAENPVLEDTYNAYKEELRCAYVAKKYGFKMTARQAAALRTHEQQMLHTARLADSIGAATDHQKAMLEKYDKEAEEQHEKTVTVVQKMVEGMDAKKAANPLATVDWPDFTDDEEETQKEPVEEQKLVTDVGPDVHYFVDVKDLDRLRDEERRGSSFSGRNASFYERLRPLARARRMRTPSEFHLSGLRILRTEMPNYGQVLDSIYDQISAQSKLSLPTKIEPILLVGPPGIGKTRFVKQLAEVLALPHFICGMGGGGDAMKMRGLSKGWSSARPGRFATDLATTEVANALYVLDEIDKAGRRNGDSAWDIHGLLLAYLEPESATVVEDDYMDCTLDVSPLNFLMTANDATLLPEPFLSRLDVYHIAGPEGLERRGVYIRMFDEQCQKWGGGLREISDCALAKMDTYSNLREAKRALSKAVAHAIGRGSKDVEASDFRALGTAPVQRRSIGFF